MRSQLAKSRIEGYGTLLPAKWKEIYEHVDDEELAESSTDRAAGTVGDQVYSDHCRCYCTVFAMHCKLCLIVYVAQIVGETLRIARLRVKELEAETNLQQTELNRLKEYVNASETAGRTLYGQQVDDLKQVCW